MTKKPRENRVPIMMSDEELASIDDWRFENRVATRSDAIRRLCQIGIATDQHFLAFADSYGAICMAAMTLAVKTDNDIDAMSVLEPVHDLGQAFGKVRAAVLTMRQGETISRALADIEEVRQAYASQNPNKALDLMKAYLKLARNDQTSAPADDVN